MALASRPWESSRWMTPEQPDPDGEQLKAMKSFLSSENGERVNYVWIDAQCTVARLGVSSSPLCTIPNKPTPVQNERRYATEADATHD